MKKWCVVFAIFVLSLIGFASAEYVSDSIPIQIQVLDDSGNPENGTFSFKIEISNSSTCSPVLYSNTTSVATDNRGVVSYNLVNVWLSFDEQYWFCYYRDNVLKSVLKAARVPYAFNAKSVLSSGIVVDSDLNFTNYNLSADRIFMNEICNNETCFTLEELNLSSGGDGNYSNFANYSSYWNGLSSYNEAQMNNSNGVLNILSDWLFNLFYQKNETYNKSEVDELLNNVSVNLTDYYNKSEVYNKTEIDDMNFSSGDSLWTNVSNVATYSGDVNVTGNLTIGAGTIWYNSSDNKYYYYNTTDWKELGSGSSGVPAGMIASFNLASCPVGWTLADGTSGTPDLRGIFIRGSGTNSVLKNANGSYFSVSNNIYSNDSFQGHRHSISNYNAAGADISPYYAPTATGQTAYGGNIMTITNTYSDGTNGNPRTGAETSPAYYSTIYCVKTSEDSEVSNSIFGEINGEVILNNINNSLNISTNISTPLLCLNGSCLSNWSNISSDFPTCAEGYVLTYDGNSLSCVLGGTSSGYINSIVESGNNSNGSYIKFIDGTMVQWGNGSCNVTISTGLLGGYRSNAGDCLTYYPIPFANSNVAYSPTVLGGVANSMITSVNSNATRADNLFVAVSSQTSATRTFMWQAVGKWTNTPYNTSTINVGGGIPSGAIVPFNLASCPVGWTLADGSNGTPDLRGIFIRGSGTNSILKYANGSYFSVANNIYANDSFQNHYHLNKYSTDYNGYGSSGNGWFSNWASSYQDSTTSSAYVTTPYTAGSSTGTPRTGSETSPAYYSTIYCVKMTEDSATSNTIWATNGNNVLLNNNSMNVNIQNSKVRATLTEGQTISTGVSTTILFNNETYDTLGEYNTSNGRFTAKQSGYYQINAGLMYTSGTWNANDVMSIRIYINGNLYSMLQYFRVLTTGAIYYSLYGADLVYMNAGDYLEITTSHDYGSDKTLYTSATPYTYVSIARIP